ncbi:MAG: hypothetical protein Q9227_003208 [Pyrenula ochraceoflavens]
MKIIIVGAGVSGLATYLQLRKVLPSCDSHTIHIYDSQRPSSYGLMSSRLGKEEDVTDSTAVVGNSIALAPSSVRLLKKIDDRVYKIFKARGYANETFTFKTARGHTLAITPVEDGRKAQEKTISCSRQGLWDCFHEIVGEDKIQHRKVCAVDLSGRRPVVRFANGGGEKRADLVVGTDGVRSVVKKAIFGTEDDANKYEPQYEGFCGVGAFISTELPASITTHKSMVFTFGPTGSFGYCSAAPLAQRKVGWWSNWPTPSPPSRNFVEDPESIRAQLRDRHGTWSDPVIQQVIENMSTDRVYPIWTTPELPYWGRRGAVLLGDAAHTLQATSGQGAAQALEDSMTFSLLLAHYISRVEKAQMGVEDAIESAIQGLYELRNPRVAVIKARARNLYVSKRRIENVFLEYLYYIFIYLWTNFPFIGRLTTGNVFRELEDWNPEEQVRMYLERTRRQKGGSDTYLLGN